MYYRTTLLPGYFVLVTSTVMLCSLFHTLLGNMLILLFGICSYELQGHTKLIHSVCWDPSGEFLASVSEDSVRVWTLGSGSEGECVHELSCNGNKFHSCVFHPTYSSLLVIGCYQASLHPFVFFSFLLSMFGFTVFLVLIYR